MTAHLTFVAAATLFMGGCANLVTVDRQTKLPFDGNSEGIAIHLDAKQRVAFAKQFGVVCAEPSPDALSTIAASFGAGVSIPSQGAATIANSLTEAGSNIGLRTQSITLMRDTLYRICELYYGRALNGVQVMHLLGRSQDLTAAVLAIEQLTGTVAARQVVLGGSSAASAASSVSHTEALVEAAKENEKQKNEELEKAKGEQTKQQQAHDKAKADFEADPDNEGKKAALSEAATKLDAAKSDVAVKKAVADEAKKTREALEKARSAALTQAAAMSTTQGSFAPPVIVPDRVQLTEQTVTPIAQAVTHIVDSVVKKDNTTDSCLAMMTDVSPILRAQKLAADATVEGDKKVAQTTAEMVSAAYTWAVQFCMNALNARLQKEGGQPVATAATAPKRQ